MNEPIITIPRLLLASHIKDMNHELRNLFNTAENLAVIDMGHFSNEIGEAVGNMVATLTSLASYMQQPTEKVEE